MFTVSFIMSSYNNSVCISSESASIKGINANIFSFSAYILGISANVIVKPWVNRKAVGYLAFLKNRWLFWLSPPNAPERPRTAANRCQSQRMGAVRSSAPRS